jgi:hypothetical protein
LGADFLDNRMFRRAACVADDGSSRTAIGAWTALPAQAATLNTAIDKTVARKNPVANIWQGSRFVTRMQNVRERMIFPTKVERISHNARLWRFDRHQGV